MVRKMTILAVVLVVAALAEGRAFQEEAQDDPYQMLEQLEKFYSQAGRPRVGRRGEVPRMDPEVMRNTLQLLQLRTITDLYKSRPRYGKRSDAFSSWIKNSGDNIPDDAPSWLTYSRRR